jgi:hypothetical protein
MRRLRARKLKATGRYYLIRHKRRRLAVKPEPYVPRPMTMQELASHAMTAADWDEAFW